MQTTRRAFIQTAAATAATSALAGAALARQEGESLPDQGFDAWGQVNEAGKKLKILILGGTGFLGPRTVRYAMLRGHEITLFNRGNRPDMFPDLELIKGNRDPDIAPGLNPLKEQIDGGRRWDLIIDTSAYVKRTAKASAELFADACDQYLFISTICAYDNWTTVKNGDETDPLAVEGPEDSEVVGQDYCFLQAVCEREFKKTMDGKTTIIRPGLIVGPGDGTDRFTYWPVRIERGGEVLVPGKHTDPVQWIDVRDLGKFIVHCGEEKHIEDFNCCGPEGLGTMGELAYACKAVTGADARFTWIEDTEFLAENQVRAWQEVPMWADPNSEEFGGVNTYSNDKAVAAGMTIRPLADTIRGTLDYWHSLPEERRATLRAGMSMEREAEVLAAWNARG